MREDIKKRLEQVEAGAIPEGYQCNHGYTFPEGWKMCKLHDRFSRLTKKNNENNENVLTISAKQGLISQEDYYNHSYASENKSGYSLLRRGDYSYNKSYSGDYPYGAIKRLEIYESGIVSPLYICFESKSGTISDYYMHYFEAGIFNREIYKVAQEGVRNHGLLNVAIDEFFSSYLLCPPTKEQHKIAEILNHCDKMIELKQQLIEEERNRKKWLMQNLLDPNSGVRLPGFAESWVDTFIKDVSTVISGGTPSTNNPEYWDGHILWCTPTDISKTNKYIASTEQTISELGLKNSSATLLPIGTVLMCSRASIGPRAIATKEISTNQGFKSFICSKKLNNEFLYYLIDVILPNLLTLASGNTFRELSKDSVDNFKISIPGICEQNAIANILVAQDNRIDLLEQELAQWNQKKKSLMKLLLTGLVRVTV